MLSENVKIGDRLEITFKRDKKSFKTYISQVEKTLNDYEFVIQVPISYGQLVELPSNEKYSFLFFTEKGMLRFDADILAVVKENGYNLMSVKLMSEGERIQRRVFFRFSCMLPLEFTVVEEETGKSVGAVCNGIIKDIGAGGVRFVCNDDLEEETQVNLMIDLSGEQFETIGKILHKQHFPKSAYTFQYRVVFIDPTATMQEKVSKFIYEEQKKQMQV